MQQKNIYTILLNCFIYLNPFDLLYSKCSISRVDINHLLWKVIVWRMWNMIRAK